MAREIGVYDFAASMPEYCGVISVKPTTRAKPERIEAEESNFDFAVLDKAIAGTRIERIQNVLASCEGVAEVDLVQIPAANDMVIDIRHPQEEESASRYVFRVYATASYSIFAATVSQVVSVDDGENTVYVIPGTWSDRISRCDT